MECLPIQNEVSLTWRGATPSDKHTVTVWVARLRIALRVSGTRARKCALPDSSTYPTDWKDKREACLLFKLKVQWVKNCVTKKWKSLKARTKFSKKISEIKGIKMTNRLKDIIGIKVNRSYRGFKCIFLSKPEETFNQTFIKVAKIWN